MEPYEAALTTLDLNADNILTAARRLVRFIRINDQHDGGMISRETLLANEQLSRHVDALTKRINANVPSHQDS